MSNCTGNVTLYARESNSCIIKSIGNRFNVVNDIFRLYLLQLVALVASEKIYQYIITESTNASTESTATQESKDNDSKEFTKFTMDAAKEAERLSEK